MKAWKLNIMVRVIKKRMQEENRTAEDIIQEYKKLKDEEKQEILDEINKENTGKQE